MNHVLKASLEAIDFQREGLLLKELSMHISALMGTKDMTERLAILKRMSATCKHHTGADFRMHLQASKEPNACIVVADSNIAAPMRPEAIKERLRKAGGIASEREMFQGSVDLRTGKVSGIYCEIPLDVFFSVGFLEKTRMNTYFTPEEIAAVIIHELGHGVMYLYYLGGIVISNIVVQEIVRKIQEGASPVVVRDVLKIAEQKTGYKIKDMGTIDKNPDPLVVQQVIMAEFVEKIRSDLGTRFYDARAFEFVADQFAARHGAGAHIVSALDRMYREGGWKPLEYSSNFGQFMAALAGQVQTIFAVGGTWAIGGSAAGVAALAGAGIWIALGVAISCLVTFIGGGDIYDDVPNRFKAMRREMIASSKEPHLTREQRLGLIQDIEIIDKALEGVQVNKFGPGFIGNFIAGVVTGKTAQMKFMRQLEELANNRLFELSNQLQAKG